MPRRHAAAPSADRLQTYRAKRDFSITSEPQGTDAPAADGWRFVVQRHRARRLHYDLRLEAAGILLSWAVPKGPTLDADVKRLAAHVEDHPLDYFDFEGVIPAGEYGGGDVVVWDWGRWALAEGDDPLDAVAAGDLHFALLGEKLRGRFALVRRGRGRDEWLLIKKHDDDAVRGWDPEDHPRSVKSGRTNDEVRASPAASWSGNADWAGPTEDELAALDALGAHGSWSIGGHALRLTDLDRVVLPGRRRGKPVTVRDLVRHHAVMAPAMLPYLADRVLDLDPVPAHPPPWVVRRGDGAAGGAERSGHIVADCAATLAWLGSAGVVELHPGTATMREPDRPTWAVFDVDPGRRGDRRTALALTRLLRTALDHLRVEGRPVVTGGRGIQVWVPVAANATFERTRHWVATVSRAVEASRPATAAVRLDDGVNAADRLLVTPFGARSAPGAPVAVPLRWEELDDDDLRPDHWTIREVQDRLRTAGDPLVTLLGRPQVLPPL